MARSRTLMRASVIGALCLGMTMLVGCSKQVSGTSIAEQVSGALTTQTGTTFTVTCPDVEAKSGTAFSCTAVGPDGVSSTINGVMSDDNGTFELTSSS